MRMHTICKSTVSKRLSRGIRFFRPRAARAGCGRLPTSDKTGIADVATVDCRR
jgi:hypothetical protein